LCSHCFLFSYSLIQSAYLWFTYFSLFLYENKTYYLNQSKLPSTKSNIKYILIQEHKFQSWGILIMKKSPFCPSMSGRLDSVNNQLSTWNFLIEPYKKVNWLTTSSIYCCSVRHWDTIMLDKNTDISRKHIFIVFWFFTL